MERQKDREEENDIFNYDYQKFDKNHNYFV